MAQGGALQFQISKGKYVIDKRDPRFKKKKKNLHITLKLKSEWFNLKIVGNLFKLVRIAVPTTIPK